MAIRRWTWVAAALLATVLSTPVNGGGNRRSSSSVRWDEGSRAAADTWAQDDGCPARTGATETVPLTEARELAWKLTVAGEIEGEPLAWKSKVFVVEKAGGKRILHVVSTATGVERYRQAFDTPLPLAPCLGEGRIVLRTGPKTLQGFAVGERALSSKWTVTAKTAMGPATVVRDEVYVVVDGVLTRRTYGSPEVVWPKGDAAGAIRVDGVASGSGAAAPAGKGATSAAATEYPRPSVRKDSVFVAAGTSLVEAERGDGSVRRKGALGTTADPRTSRVIVGLGDVLVACGTKFHDDDHDADTCRFALAESGPFEKCPSLSAPFGLASLGRDWVGGFGKGGTLTLALLGTAARVLEADRELATSAMHAEFLEAKVPPTTAGDVVFVGGRAFDADTLDLLRPEAIPSISRTILLRDRLLVVETKNRLTAWRSVRKPADVAPLRLFGAGAGAPATLAAGHAVLDDGRVVAGAFALDAKTGGLAATGGPATGGPATTGKPADAGVWPIASVRGLLSDDAPRRLLLASRPEDGAAAVAAIARAEAAGELLALVAPAVAAGDAALARRVHTAAAERGAPATDLARLGKDVDALEAKGAERIEDKAADVEARLAALLGREPDLLVEAATSLPDAVPVVYATTLVRAAVDRARYHAGATAWVRAHLPEGLSPKGISDLPEWLDFVDLGPGAAVRILGPRTEMPADVPAAVAEALVEARAKWREDVVGFLNGPLLVVSPPEHPSAISRCLALGRIVSDRLDADFASIGPARTESEILVLHLFPNQPEYLKQSVSEKNPEPSGGFGGLENTAGHYDPGANVTRIFFPADEGGDSVVGTYTHELTHHWIARRRPPRSGDESLGDAAGGPGYFVVEGYADFVRSFTYDAASRTANPANPRAEYADVVAACPADKLVPWPKVFAFPQRDAYAMIKEGEVRLALRWRMGHEHGFSLGTLYYAQAAATTAYLFLADGGKYRPALFKHLYDHYAGQSDPDALLKAVGCSADELGARIVAWCKATVGAPK